MAKYSVTDKTDSTRVSFLLHDNFEQTDPPRDQVSLQPTGAALKTFQTSGDWKRVSVPFDYNKNGKCNTHYLLATFSSSHKAGKGNANAKLWIDEVELIYNRSEQAFISNE